MGTWATDPFGNDHACDWGCNLAKTKGLDFIRETLESALSGGGEYLDSHEGDHAIAAADTVARLRGHFGVRNAYTESVDQWVQKQREPIPQELVDLALRTVERVLTEPSELLELWEDSGADEWIDEMEALKERLS